MSENSSARAGHCPVCGAHVGGTEDELDVDVYGMCSDCRADNDDADFDTEFVNVPLTRKLSVQEFGELCNRILDAFERGKPEIPTVWGVELVGHIEAVYKEQENIEQERGGDTK